MKKHFILPKGFFSTASRPSINKISAVLVLILCFGISPAWGAKPGAILYVDASAAADGDGTSWNKAFTDLQDAMDAAVSGDEIWVAAGTYTPSEKLDSSKPRTAAFILKSGVKIYGSFAGDEDKLNERQLDPSLTVLSGDIGTTGVDTDNSYHVVYAYGVTDAVLDGFTVTGGRNEIYYNGGDGKGAGMYNYNSSLTVANCTFIDNKVSVITHNSGGAGAGMYNHNSAPIVSNCTFIANIAGNASNNTEGRGGGMYNEGSFGTGYEERWPTVTHCTFRENVASSHYGISAQNGGGGGMYNLDSYPLQIVDNCVFEGNWAGRGGGIYNQGMATIRNCIFIANYNLYSDGYGGAIFNMGRSTIVNCTFYQNGWRFLPFIPPRVMSSGGAIYDYRVGSTITNCIFSENAVFGSGGAVSSNLLYYHGTTLTNCLFHENKSWQGYHDPRDTVINHVAGDVDVVNALYDIDPLLVDPAAGDFHLLYDSPCIDAGYSLKRGYFPNNVYPTELPTTDFEGDKRIVDGDGDGVPTVDIGVDEFVPNLPDLRAFLEALADRGELDEATAARLLAYVDDAQTALDQNRKKTAIGDLNQLIDDVQASLGDTETAQLIVMKTEAVIDIL